MNHEQYTRTKGETIVPDEIISRLFSPEKHEHQKAAKRNSTSEKLPYWQWRLLKDMMERSDRPSQISEVHHYHSKLRRWEKAKLVLTTLIAAPIVIIEIGLLLRFLFER